MTSFSAIKIGSRFRFVPNGPIYEKIGNAAFRFADPPNAGPYLFRDKRHRPVLLEKDATR